MTTFLQFTTIAANLIVFIFAGYFLIDYMRKEKLLEDKEKDMEKKRIKSTRSITKLLTTH